MGHSSPTTQRIKKIPWSSHTELQHFCTQTTKRELSFSWIWLRYDWGPQSKQSSIHYSSSLQHFPVITESIEPTNRKAAQSVLKSKWHKEEKHMNLPTKQTNHAYGGSGLVKTLESVRVRVSSSSRISCGGDPHFRSWFIDIWESDPCMRSQYIGTSN